MRSWAERERKKGQLLARSLKAPLENNHKRTSLVTRQQAPRFESTAFKRRPKHKRLSGADRTQTRQHVTSTTLLHTSLAPFKKKRRRRKEATVVPVGAQLLMAPHSRIKTSTPMDLTIAFFFFKGLFHL
jgi:hypothetical protein